MEYPRKIVIDKTTGEILEDTEKKWRDIDQSSPFKEFVQLNIEGKHDEILRNLIRKYPPAMEMFIFLMKHMDKRNALVCSYRVLMEALDYSESTIKRAIRVLKEEKFVQIKKSGTTNVFLLNADLLWKSWGKNHQYAEFEAKLLIAKSEQEKDVKVTKKNYPVVDCERKESLE